MSIKLSQSAVLFRVLCGFLVGVCFGRFAEAQTQVPTWNLKDPLKLEVTMPDGDLRRYVIVRDIFNPFRFYYLLETGQLVDRRVTRINERGQSSDRWPECQLVRFQREAPDRPGVLQEGATLRMTFEHQTTDPFVLAALRRQLLDRLPYLSDWIEGETSFPDLKRLKNQFDFGERSFERDYFHSQLPLGNDHPLIGSGGMFYRDLKTQLFPDLVLHPLPVRQVKVSIPDPLKPEAGLPVYVSFPGRWHAGDYKWDYRTIHVTVDLNREQALLVESMLHSPTMGLPIRFEYQWTAEWGLPFLKYYRLDPSEIVNSYLERLLSQAAPVAAKHTMRAERRPMSNQQAQLIHVLAREWRRAVELGYRPAQREEAVRWARLIDYAQSQHPDTGAYSLTPAESDTLQNGRQVPETVLASVAYLMRYLSPLAPPNDFPLPLIVGRDLVGTSTYDHSQFLNFVTYPGYRCENGQLLGEEKFQHGKRLFQPEYWKDAEKALKFGEAVYAPSGDPLYVSLRDCPPHVVEELIGHRGDELQLAAVELPDMAVCAGPLGIEEFEVRPAIEFQIPSNNPWATSLDDFIQQLNEVIQYESRWLVDEDPPTATKVRRGSRDFVRLDYPATTWRTGAGWSQTRNVLRSGEQAAISVSLKSLRALGKELSHSRQNAALTKAEYIFSQSVRSAYGNVEYETRMPVFRGRRTLRGPGELFEVLQVDGQRLPWAFRDSGPSDAGAKELVRAVRVTMREGGGEFAAEDLQAVPEGARQQQVRLMPRTLRYGQLNTRSPLPRPEAPSIPDLRSRMSPRAPGSADGHSVVHSLPPAPLRWLVRRPNAEGQPPVRVWIEFELVSRAVNDREGRRSAKVQVRTVPWESNNKVLEGSDLAVVLQLPEE